jgi:hypothetical protein
VPTYPVARRLVRRAWRLITNPGWADIARPPLSLVTLGPPRVKLIVFGSRLRRRIAEAPIKLTLMCCFSLARSSLAVCLTRQAFEAVESHLDLYGRRPAPSACGSKCQHCDAEMPRDGLIGAPIPVALPARLLSTQ